ncbi:MAG: RimK family alpha-L-glutamate ligase [Chitinophagales bacterium]
MNILILASSTKQSTSTNFLVAAAQKRGHTVTVWSYLEMYFWVNSIGGHHRLYHKGKRLHRGDFDVVIPRIGKELTYGVEILEIIIHYLKIPSIIPSEALSLVTNKWHTFSRLAQHGILMPKTVKIHRSPHDLPHIVKWLGGYPLILKSETGSQGKGVMVLETPTTAKMLIEEKVRERVIFILQQFVNTSNDKRKQDIRVWVINGKVIGAYIRHSGEDGDPRTNYSINKMGQPVEITENEKSVSLKTAKAVGLQVAAIDLARCISTGQTYVFEVNGNGSLKGFSKVTQIPLADHIIDYAEKVGQEKINLPQPTSVFIENIPMPFEDINEGNTELISSRITPSLKQYLQDYAKTHDYENLSACIKALLYNSSAYFNQNEALRQELVENKGRLKTLQTLIYKDKEEFEDSLQTLQTINQQQEVENQDLKGRLKTLQATVNKGEQRFQGLAKRQSKSLYMGDHFKQFQDLSAGLQREFGDALPLLLALYWQEIQANYTFMPNLNNFVKHLNPVKL